MNAVAALRGNNAAGRHDAAAVVGIGLWVFMGVVTVLFSLFIAAYVMRMDASDWSVIAMPWQLWLSTALLVAGSAALQQASAAARLGHRAQARARALLLAGGGCALAFLAVQLWAWQALLAIQVGPAGNPAASFFYLLTAMHGLHVAGGLVAWGLTARSFLRDGDAAAQSPPGRPKTTGVPLGGSEIHEVTSVGATSPTWRIALCARYWHFLLALWLLLFATLGGLTPEVVRFICGTN